MTLQAPSHDVLLAKQQRAGRYVAISCVILAAVLAVAAGRDGVVFGLPLKIAWRLPFLVGASGALAWLAIAAWRTGYVVGNSDLIDRRTRGVAFWCRVVMMFVLSVALLAGAIVLVRLA